MTVVVASFVEWCQNEAVPFDDDEELAARAAARGERLRAARAAKGLGVRELSREAGLPGGASDVSKIENGKQPSPNYDKIRALAAVLEVNSEWLWSGEGPRDRRDEAAAGEALAPFDAARAMFLSEQVHEGRGDEARKFLGARAVAFAGAERKSPQWWLATLTEEFREWRTNEGTDPLPKLNPRRRT